MKEIIIAIGADHRGYSMKEYIKQECVIQGYCLKWLDVGTDSEERSDYPVFAIKVVRFLQNQDAEYGVLLCGTGVGMTIVANRFKGIYAGLAWNEDIARKAKEDDNINVLVLPSDYVDNKTARAMVITWLVSEFRHMRYEKRIAMIDAIIPRS